jgi:hypothetical protein
MLESLKHNSRFSLPVASVAVPLSKGIFVAGLLHLKIGKMYSLKYTEIPKVFFT